MDSLEFKLFELLMVNFLFFIFIMLLFFFYFINDGVGCVVIVVRRVIVFLYVINCDCFDSLIDGFFINKL